MMKNTEQSFLKDRRPKRNSNTEGANEQLVAGRNAIRELLASGRDIDKVFVARGERDGALASLISEILTRRIPLVEADKRRLDTMCGHRNHQGIVAFTAARDYATVDAMLDLANSRGEKPFLVIADGIEDPHNLGAIIRSAECAGAHGLIIPKRRAVGLTDVVAKASAGAIEHLLVAKVVNLSETIRDLQAKGVWVYAADMDGTNYYETDFSSGTALVLGNEGSGISRLVAENCDFTVSIPMFGQINSMNVSAAAAVLLCEVSRQRHIQK